MKPRDPQIHWWQGEKIEEKTCAEQQKKKWMSLETVERESELK